MTFKLDAFQTADIALAAHCAPDKQIMASVGPVVEGIVDAAVAAERERTAGILQQFADTRGVNVGDVDDDWWRGYRQAQRECLHDAAELTARIARAGEEK